MTEQLKDLRRKIGHKLFRFGKKEKKNHREHSNTDVQPDNMLYFDNCSVIINGAMQSDTQELQ